MKPVARVRTYTPEQRKHRIEHQMQVYRERLAKGICPMCGKRPLADGFKTCNECRERRNLLARKKRARYVLEGRCTSCGRELSQKEKEEGYAECLKCRMHFIRNYYRRKK